MDESQVGYMSHSESDSERDVPEFIVPFDLPSQSSQSQRSIIQMAPPAQSNSNSSNSKGQGQGQSDSTSTNSTTTTKQKRRLLCTVESCAYTTPYSKDLARHMRKHTGEKPYTCDRCPKSYSRYDKLVIHFRCHDGHRPFKCKHCDYACVDSSSLRKHLRIHNDERPYKCQVCPYAARESSQLIVHLRHHTGDSPYFCMEDGCDAAFTTASDLKRHTRLHTGDKPYSCPKCEYKAAVKSNLNVHMKKHLKFEVTSKPGEVKGVILKLNLKRKGNSTSSGPGPSSTTILRDLTPTPSTPIPIPTPTPRSAGTPSPPKKRQLTMPRDMSPVSTSTSTSSSSESPSPLKADRFERKETPDDEETAIATATIATSSFEDSNSNLNDSATELPPIPIPTPIPTDEDSLPLISVPVTFPSPPEHSSLNISPQTATTPPSASRRTFTPKKKAKFVIEALPFQFACKQCSFKADTLKIFSSHLKKQHPDSITLKSQKRIPLSTSSTPTPSQGKVGRPRPSRRTKLPQGTGSELEKFYDCSVCMASFVRNDSLRCHMRQHSELLDPTRPQIQDFSMNGLNGFIIDNSNPDTVISVNSPNQLVQNIINSNPNEIQQTGILFTTANYPNFTLNPLTSTSGQEGSERSVVEENGIQVSIGTIGGIGNIRVGSVGSVGVGVIAENPNININPSHHNQLYIVSPGGSSVQLIDRDDFHF